MDLPSLDQTVQVPVGYQEFRVQSALEILGYGLM